MKKISGACAFLEALRCEGVKHIFIAMIEGVREEVLCRGLADTGTWEKGIRDLYRTTEQGGSFCYTFFKAIGEKERSGPD